MRINRTHRILYFLFVIEVLVFGTSSSWDGIIGLPMCFWPAKVMFTNSWKFTEILNVYFKKKLEELNTMIDGSGENDQLASHDFSGRSNVSAWDFKMDIDSQETVISESGNLVKNIGKVVRDLRCLGFTSMTEDSYSSAIIWLLKVHTLFCA